ncbi:hypothetical protein [Brunnivagina elsteri]|uniref:hypothetical protein n=1 Tax=Brunnivagina elsteri TaxID=1247191 RepID=UPI001178B5A0|nr:hypothetical protein [Calothrix elsteri]
MQLSHLPHVLLAISHTVLALNSLEVQMRSLGYSLGYVLESSPSRIGGESCFGFTVRHRNRASFITIHLAIKYIERISSLSEPSLVVTSICW